MSTANRFVVILISLWSRWKMLVPAALVILASLSSLYQFISALCVVMGFSFAYVRFWCDRKRILLTEAQAEFLVAHSSESFLRRLALRPPETLHDLWEALKAEEQAGQEALAAQRRNSLVKIFQLNRQESDYDEAKEQRQAEEQQECL